nr:hypothetical protein [Sphingomonas sp. CL5.1]
MAELFALNALAALVEMVGKRGDAHGAIGRALQIGFEHIADEIDGLGVMLELLAILAARLGNGIGAKAEGRGLTVPKAVHGVGDHRAPNMLGVLGRVIFVEDGEHGDGHVGGGIVAEILGD